MKAFLILEDGTVFTGTSIGSKKEIISEIVFNTSMTGYLEVLTDPSYAGQAVCMTYPGLRQLPLHKTSCKIAGSRLNSGFFIAKTCQFFEKYLLYVLCGVVLYGIILV